MSEESALTLAALAAKDAEIARLTAALKRWGIPAGCVCEPENYDWDSSGVLPICNSYQPGDIDPRCINCTHDRACHKVT